MKKTLGEKNMVASVSLGDDLLVPYSDSKVFAEIDDKKGEIYILIKNSKENSNDIKLFFKETGVNVEDVNEEK
tara:strand:- start:2797 stop:3015 length:219 start_codon:yes stop_codon:yes gene_type:complete